MALYLTILNYNFYYYIFKRFNADNAILTLSVIATYFALCIVLFCIVFVPYLTKFFSILFILITSIASYFIYTYGVFIDANLLYSILETNFYEAKGFISLNLLIYVLFSGVIPIIFVLMCDIKYGKILKTRAILMPLFVAILLIVHLPFRPALVSFYKTQYYQSKFHLLPYITINQIYRLARNLLRYSERLPVGLDALHLDAKKDAKLLVFIIGESARAQNFSIGGGYKRNDTNFYTKQEPNLVYFKNVMSCGTFTRYSVPCMFSPSTRKEFVVDVENKDNIFDILARLGFNVYFISSNSKYGRCNGVCDRIEHKNKVFVFPAIDGFLLEPFKQRIKNDKTTNQVIVLHLYGSHYPYEERYPDEFAKFKPVCKSVNLRSCDYENLLNTYDNSILYTDYLITQVINITKNLDKETLVFYTSDHGESLGEDGVFSHSAPYDTAPVYQNHVPMMIYSNNKSKLAILRAKQDENLSHDYVFSTILGFFNIQTSAYNKNLDLLK